MLLFIQIPVRIIPPLSYAIRSAVREEPTPTCAFIFIQQTLLSYILAYTMKSGICHFHRTLALLVAKDITKHKAFQAVLFLLPSGSHFSADNLVFYTLYYILVKFTCITMLRTLSLNRYKMSFCREAHLSTSIVAKMLPNSTPGNKK